MDFKDLIGAKLIAVFDNGFSIQKDNKAYNFTFEDYEGDCCGYNNIETVLLMSDDNQDLNPIITDIKYHKEETGESEVAEIVFFGIDKEIYKVNCLSSSSSGWCYGACVRLTCKQLKFDKVITSW